MTSAKQVHGDWISSIIFEMKKLLAILADPSAIPIHLRPVDAPTIIRNAAPDKRA
jgi:hypothetical protein